MMSGVTLTTVNTAESSGTPVPGELKFTRAQVTSQPLTVNFEVAGSAQHGRDYFPNPGGWTQVGDVWRGSVTIPANAATATVLITPDGDSEFERDENVEVTVLDSSGNPSGAAAKLVIADDDDWLVSIETKNANDPGGTAADAVEGTTDKGYYTITRTQGTDLRHELPVEFLIQGSAKFQQDYTLSLGTGSGSYLSIAADGKSGTAKIPTGDTDIILVLTAATDSVQEPDDLATLQLVARPPSGLLGATGYDVLSSKATVTIEDSGAGAPAVHVEALDKSAFEPSSATEPAINKEARQGEFVIRRGGPTTASLVVWYTVLESTTPEDDGTAELADYAAWWGTNAAPIYQQAKGGYYGSVTIPASAEEVRFQIDPVFDQLRSEGDETFDIRLEPPQTGAAYVVDHPNTASITISDSGSNQGTYCFCTCGCDPVLLDVDANSGKLFVVPNLVSEVQPVYISKDNPHPIITADVRLQPMKDGANLASIEAVLDVGGARSDTVFYSPGGVQSGELYRFALQADASSLATGRHDYTITITQRYGATVPSTVMTIHGQKDIRNRRESDFGNRWSIAGVDRLIPHENGVSLEQGDGNMAFFLADGQGGFRGDDKLSFVTLTGDWSTGFTLRDKYGNESEFDNQGLLRFRRDPAGNQTEYVYAEMDSDDAPELWKIIDPAGRTTILQYAGGKLSTLIDFAGRATTFAYQQGLLTSIVQPDPNSGDAVDAPVIQFGYDPTTQQMTSIIDPEQKKTTIDYNFAGVVSKITDPELDARTYDAAQAYGLVNLAAIGTAENPMFLMSTANARARRLDELFKPTFIEVDRFGLTTKTTDPSGNVTVYERNSLGQVTKTIEQDPDGTGPLLPHETVFTFDARGNLSKIVHPDGSAEEWIYDAVWNVPESYTDRRGYLTLYQIDPANGQVTEERRVIGAVDDAALNGETDDVITKFTYTVKPADVVAGQLETVIDPLGRQTRFDYNGRGLIERITYAVGTGDEASVEFLYDSRDRLESEIDELGRQTRYLYDELDRVQYIVQPNAAGLADLATSPVTEFGYDKKNRVVKEVDAEGRVTSFEYFNDGNVKKIIRPDHDSDSELSVTEMTYTERGQLWTVKDALQRVTTWIYDALRRNTEIIRPDHGDADSEATVTKFTYDRMHRLTPGTRCAEQPNRYGVHKFRTHRHDHLR